jgi:hypothetical protein
LINLNGPFLKEVLFLAYMGNHGYSTSTKRHVRLLKHKFPDAYKNKNQKRISDEKRYDKGFPSCNQHNTYDE